MIQGDKILFKEEIVFGKKEEVAPKATIPTYIGYGMKIEGKLRCTGPIRIDGEIRGTINCDGEITIGSTARILADIRAQSIVVNGRVEGNLYSTHHLEVLEEGHIIGNVSNPPGLLIVHEGAIIEGQCLTEVPLPPKIEVVNPLLIELPSKEPKKKPTDEAGKKAKTKEQNLAETPHSAL